MKHSNLYLINIFRILKTTGKVFGIVFKLAATAIWTVCMLAGGELGLAAIGAGIIFFGFSAILN
ncbi:MAG: hypothetical protein J6Y89_04355 [Lachnospiraceae bacterium]|nr:hypothetical protein [Lachnospiraceae bacterium]